MCLIPTEQQSGHLIYEWEVVNNRSKNEQKDVCLVEIGLCAQNVLTILSSIVNMIGRLLWPLNEHESLPFENE